MGKNGSYPIIYLRKRIELETYKQKDFDFLKDLENNIPTEYFNQGETKGYSKWDVMGHIKNLLNYVEDLSLIHI